MTLTTLTTLTTPTERQGAELFGRALRGEAIQVRLADGRRRPLDGARWLGPARGADLSLLRRTTGPVLDVGCGPGRLAAALSTSGVSCLGVEVDATAVSLTRAAGAAALRRSVFEPLPGTGRWATALLADGNIGIGGDPVRLLRRAAELLAPEGRVVVELTLEEV